MSHVFFTSYDSWPEKPQPPFVNPGKAGWVTWQNGRWRCLAIRTPVVDGDTRLDALFDRYVSPWLTPGDVVFCSEKMIACAQGRAILLTDIKPSAIARFLSRFVTRSPYGIGLSMPETMQCAIDEVGLWRILLAAAWGCIGKCLGKKGWFYRVAGAKAAAVDGPCSYTLPPYNRYVVPGPAHPEKTAAALSALLDGAMVLLVDANDLGCRILASSHPTDYRKWEALLAQNPLGQSDQQTPVGILRPAAGDYLRP